MPVSRIELPTAPVSAQRARAWLKASLGSWANQVARDDATLMLSEVVTNALRHAGGGVVLITLTLTPGHLLVEVHDESSSLPIRRRSGQVGGWGLQLIELLSSRWGIDLHSDGDGKTIWFEMDES